MLSGSSCLSACRAGKGAAVHLLRSQSSERSLAVKGSSRWAITRALKKLSYPTQ
jgi:hypothetical protein